MEARVKVVKLEVKHFKGVEEFRAALPAVGLFVIGGGNEAGKSSSLDALAWAAGGDRFKPTDPNRGLESAEIKAELSNGLTLERKGKNGTLKITGGRNVQKTIDDFICPLALDLRDFLHATPKEQAKMLLAEYPGLGEKLDALNVKEKRLYDDRVLIGRSRELKQKHADDLPHIEGIPETLMTSTEMATELQAAMAVNAENEARRRRHTTNVQEMIRAEKELSQKQERVAEIEAMLQRAKDDVALVEDRVRGCKAIVEESKKVVESCRDLDIQTVKDRMAAIDSLNAQIRQNMEKQHALDEAAEFGRQYDNKSVEIEAVRQDRLDLLNAVQWPLPGMSIEDGALIFAGQRWDCMAANQRYRVAVACVGHMKPTMGFVLLDGLELMDLDTLKKFDEFLRTQNLQGIGTRVSMGPECDVILEDGNMVKGDELT